MILDTLQSIDSNLLIAVRSSIPAGNHLVALFVKIFSDIEVLASALVMAGLWLFGTYKKDIHPKIQALQLFYTIIAAFVLYWILNLGMPMRPRPETVTAIAPIISHLPDNSFPSGHAIFAAASVFAAFRFLKKQSNIAWVLLILGTIMCYARVLAGVHYPGDIIVGAMAGSLFAWGISSYIAKLSKDSSFFQLPIRIAAWIKL